MKVFKYRLYPSKRQNSILKKYLSVCQKVYNKCLEYKIEEYKNNKKSISEFNLNKLICKWRSGSETWMQDCGIAILHDVSRRVDKAFSHFFKRVKDRSGKAGFPRFKSANRYDSFSVPRFTFRIKNNKIRLTNDLGWVKLKYHRPIQGEIKGYNVSRNSCGEWFICITVDVPERHNTAIDRSNNVGIDFGCKNVLTLSDGIKFESLKFYKKAEKELAKAQRKKRKDVVAKIHKKIKNKRENYCHEISNQIVKNYDLIFVEDINHSSLSKNTFKSVRKSITDGAWHKLSLFLSYKAVEAGKIFGKVNPADTSKTCSNCGKMHEKQALKDRVMNCSCGYIEDRDINAARNVLRRGLASFCS